MFIHTLLGWYWHRCHLQTFHPQRLLQKLTHPSGFPFHTCQGFNPINRFLNRVRRTLAKINLNCFTVGRQGTDCAFPTKRPDTLHTFRCIDPERPLHRRTRYVRQLGYTLVRLTFALQPKYLHTLLNTGIRMVIAIPANCFDCAIGKTIRGTHPCYPQLLLHRKEHLPLSLTLSARATCVTLEGEENIRSSRMGRLQTSRSIITCTFTTETM